MKSIESSYSRKELDQSSDTPNWRLMIGSTIAAFALFIVFVIVTKPEVNGMLPYYRAYRELLTGTGEQAPVATMPTFPMWGYSWLIVRGENETVSSLFQFVLGVGSLAFFLWTGVKARWISGRSATIVWVLTATALPWYAFHAAPFSASSVASSLIIMALAFIIRACDAADWKAVANAITAALCFGIALNFRSDTYLLPPIIGAILLWQMRAGYGLRIVAAVSWLGIVYTSLLPWMMYTKRACGHYLLTSTNAGHVMYLGLGCLPNNKWGITPEDGDSSMRSALAQRFGPDASSLTLTGDDFLRQHVRTLVQEAPAEYVKKCVFIIFKIFAEGFYPGVFDSAYRDRVRMIYPWQSTTWIMLNDPRALLREVRPRTIVAIFAELQARVLLVVGLLSTIVLSVHAWRIRNLMYMLSLFLILYQFALNIATFYMRIYSNNLFVFLMLFAAIAWTEFRPLSQELRRIRE